MKTKNETSLGDLADFMKWFWFSTDITKRESYNGSILFAIAVGKAIAGLLLIITAFTSVNVDRFFLSYDIENAQIYTMIIMLVFFNILFYRHTKAWINGREKTWWQTAKVFSYIWLIMISSIAFAAIISLKLGFIPN